MEMLKALLELLKGKILDSEPVAWLAVAILVAIVVQKVWLGEVITQDWVEWALGIFGLATGAGVVRQSVYSKKTVEGEPYVEDHGE